MPPQDCNNQYILDHIGRHSLTQTEGGWTWKFDDGLFRKMAFDTNMSEGLAKIGCRVGVIYGQDSYLFGQEVADYMFKVLDESVPFVAIPEAQHHLFLDQPLAFVAALRTLLAEWRHSKPLRAVPSVTAYREGDLAHAVATQQHRTDRRGNSRIPRQPARH